MPQIPLRRQLSIGVYPSVTLAQARSKRDEARRMIAEGLDPSHEKQAQKRAHRESTANIFKAIASEWFEHKSRTWTARYLADQKARIENNVYPAVGHRPVSEIRPLEMLGCLRDIEGAGKLETLRKTRQICVQIYAYAIVTGRATSNPADYLNTALLSPERGTNRSLSAAQLTWLATHKDTAKTAEALARWNTVIPADYGEQVHRVKDRFAILEAALLLSVHITGWEVQACRDALQHVFHVWIAEFGTGNKEHQQIIEQAPAFLMANSISRFIPVDFDEVSQLNVHNLAGYKDKGAQQTGEPVTFYVLPAPFKDELANGFDVNQIARVLHQAGMLKKPASGRSWQGRTPRIRHMNNRQLRFMPCCWWTTASQNSALTLAAPFYVGSVVSDKK